MEYFIKEFPKIDWQSLFIVGIFIGALIAAIGDSSFRLQAFPTMKATVLTWGNFGKITLPQLFGINHWIIIIPIVARAIFLFRWIEKKGF